MSATKLLRRKNNNNKNNKDSTENINTIKMPIYWHL